MFSLVLYIVYNIAKARFENTGIFPKRTTAANVAVVRNIRNIIKPVNPPTQSEITSKCGVFLGTFSRIIYKYLKVKLRKKCRVHRLSEAQVHKGVIDHGVCVFVWTVENVVTTDEAMFYMGGSYGRRRVCYMRSSVTDFHKLNFVKRDLFAPGVMVWTDVSYHDKTLVIFIDKGVKVNADYYISKVLK